MSDSSPVISVLKTILAEFDAENSRIRQPTKAARRKHLVLQLTLTFTSIDIPEQVSTPIIDAANEITDKAIKLLGELPRTQSTKKAQSFVLALSETLVGAIQQSCLGRTPSIARFKT